MKSHSNSKYQDLNDMTFGNMPDSIRVKIVRDDY